jgi:hypothetical protein
MTTAKPLARYALLRGALACGFAYAELHHLWRHDLLVVIFFIQVKPLR